MPVDSYRYLPRSFRAGYEATTVEVDGPVWAPLAVPITEATVAMLTSGGLYLEGEQQPFDLERERREPTWGDPTYRVIPRGTPADRVGASHLHINTRDLVEDYNVALALGPLDDLVEAGRVGRSADEHYSVMGFQERSLEGWRERTGPEIARRLREAGVHALILAPA